MKWSAMSITPKSASAQPSTIGRATSGGANWSWAGVSTSVGTAVLRLGGHVAEWGSDQDLRREVRPIQPERDHRAERIATDELRDARHEECELVECRRRVESFADAVVEVRPEVESERGDTHRRQRSVQRIDNRVEAVAAVLRVGMAHDRCRSTRRRNGEVTDDRDAVVGLEPHRTFGVSAHGNRRYPARSMPGLDDKLPIKMLNDRVLVSSSDDGERKSSGGILIPATAEMAKRLVWATVVAQGQNVRCVRSRRQGPVQPGRPLRGRSPG